jgi:hypothetical protein
MISQELWHVRSSNLNPCDFHLWALQKIKCLNNSHSLREPKENIQREISVIPRQLHCVSRNIFSRCDTCTEAGWHFETLLWTVVDHTVEGKMAVNNWLLLLCYVESLP